jgi:hypothetical protein
MPDPEHLSKLWSGVDSWNQWRRENRVIPDLREAALPRANLRDADLSVADLAGAHLGWTGFGNVDLREVKGLEHAQHDAPSTIGIDTIYRSQGKIPESFLRGAGVPEAFIVQMKALVGAMETIQFYSCFISYSSQDQAFAERLHADLQAKSVRCWFAPHAPAHRTPARWAECVVTWAGQPRRKIAIPGPISRVTLRASPSRISDRVPRRRRKRTPFKEERV